MDMCVRKLPKKRKFDPSELEENSVQNLGTPCIPVSVVQSVITTPQATAVDYSCPPRLNEENTFNNKYNVIDLSEWCDHRVLAKQGDWYFPGVIRDANGANVSIYSLLMLRVYRLQNTELSECNINVYSQTNLRRLR